MDVIRDEQAQEYTRLLRSIVKGFSDLETIETKVNVSKLLRVKDTPQGYEKAAKQLGVEKKEFAKRVGEAKRGGQSETQARGNVLRELAQQKGIHGFDVDAASPFVVVFDTKRVTSLPRAVKASHGHSHALSRCLIIPGHGRELARIVAFHPHASTSNRTRDVESVISDYEDELGRELDDDEIREITDAVRHGRALPDIEAFNPNHDELGRFAEGDGGATEIKPEDIIDDNPHVIQPHEIIREKPKAGEKPNKGSTAPKETPPAVREKLERNNVSILTKAVRLFRDYVIPNNPETKNPLLKPIAQIIGAG